MEGEVMATGCAQEEAGVPRPVGLTACFALLGFFWGAMLAAGHVAHRVGFSVSTASWGNLAVAAVAGAILATLAWEFRRGLVRTMTSLPFSVALLGLLLVLTAVGTVVLQQAPPESYVERHGHALGALLLVLGMDDLFHAAWFTGLLALLAASLLLTIVENRAWRLPMWGHLCCHLGVVTVLAGGWIGSRYGFKGVIDLHEGQAAGEARVLGKGGIPGEGRPLGFSLLLEKFDVEHYKPEARFYVYEKAGEEYRVVRSFGVEEVLAKRPLGTDGSSFHLVMAYPDFMLSTEVLEVPQGSGGPVLQVDFKHEGRTVTAALQAGVPGRDAALLSPQGPPARFIWDTPSAAEMQRYAEASPEAHVVSVMPAGGGGEPEELVVGVGTTARFASGNFDLQVIEYLPDFSYDGTAKKARTRSQDPNNPALHVKIRDLKTGEEHLSWLFSNMPDFGHGSGHGEGGPRFTYRYEPAHQPAERELLILGAARQFWGLERGRKVREAPLETWTAVCEGLPVAGMQVHPSAVVEAVPGTRSQAWENPVADIVLEEGGAARKLRLTAGHGQPVPLADGKRFLALEMRADEPKAFRSSLAVLEDGKKVAGKTIVVNDPLSYGGYMFYQSNFRKEDPTYSGIQVVKDPGLGVVFAGFAMMSLGVIFVYYIRPRILERLNHGI